MRDGDVDTVWDPRLPCTRGELRLLLHRSTADRVARLFSSKGTIRVSTGTLLGCLFLRCSPAFHHTINQSRTIWSCTNASRRAPHISVSPHSLMKTRRTSFSNLWRLSLLGDMETCDMARTMCSPIHGLERSTGIDLLLGRSQRHTFLVSVGKEMLARECFFSFVVWALC